MTTPPTTTDAEPTGLDYQAAYAAMYPGLPGTGVKIHELNDAALRVVSRAARLRRAERERIKAVVLAWADRLEEEADESYADPMVAMQMEQDVASIRKLIEEIR